MKKASLFLFLFLFLTAIAFCLWGYRKRLASEYALKSEYAFFYYESHGAPGSYVDEYILDLEKKELQTTYAKNQIEFWEGKKQIQTIKLSDSQITMLKNALNNAKVKSWRSGYDNPYVCDGTFWSSNYRLENGHTGSSRGANAWPKGFGDLIKAIESVNQNKAK